MFQTGDYIRAIQTNLPLGDVDEILRVQFTKKNLETDMHNSCEISFMLMSQHLGDDKSVLAQSWRDAVRYKIITRVNVD